MTVVSDPLPFHFLSQQPELCAGATFVDVDYPQLMHKKRACISNSAALQELLPVLSNGVSNGPDIWRAGQYLTVGCDLRKLSELEAILKKEVHVHDCAILFVAEVSIAYMDVKSADAVVAWASTFKHGHFDKLHAHLRVVYQYPTPKDQEARFRNAGWESATARTLWELWGDDEFLPPSQRKKLDSIEPFDEWEELALLGGHYLLLVATTSAPTSQTDDPQARIQYANAKLSMQPVPREGDESSLRRFGATYSRGNKVIYHGGYGERTRLGDCDTYTADAVYEGKVELQPGKPGAIMCQTITNVASGDDLFLLAGGRESPSKAAAGTWLVTSTGRSISADSFNADRVFNGRYRHCAVPVLVDNKTDAPGVLIYGGKSDASTVLGDFLLFDLKKQSWSVVPCVESEQGGGVPPARFGASMCQSEQSASLGQQSGILMGGISEDGTILSDVWEWALSWEADGLTVKCTERTREVELSGAAQFARFGAAMIPLSNHFLLIGGVTRDRILGWNEEILLVSLGPERWVKHIQMPACPSPRPLFVGVGAAKIGEKIVLVGGGAVCFSMGSFWNKKSYSLRLDYDQGEAPSDSCGQGPHGTDETAGQLQANGSREGGAASENLPDGNDSFPAPAPVKQIGRAAVRTREDFDAIVAAGQPAILTGLDIGPCVDLWTPEYLVSRIGAGRSATTTLDLSKDFPAIASDLRLPEALLAVAADDNNNGNGNGNALLRISGPSDDAASLRGRLHYDALANARCQIRGAERVRLFPPGDVALLAYPAGASSSSSDVDVWHSPTTGVGRRSTTAGLVHAHPHEAVLHPGDVLLIPPAWSHAARPEEDGGNDVSVVVDVFWRSVARELYGIGNRDIAAYEEGRKAVETIVKGFDGVPKDLRRFYLERLVGELREKADEGAGEKVEVGLERE
ncbi:tRNA methyltransferase ppm2 [Diplodia seriata]|uniref:tRNA wybutosine-synthesizing protein 4 n=1 Tax=Diplodia seriata TaxID=420778 RepID=A0ABR3CPU2_9PEZI